MIETELNTSFNDLSVCNMGGSSYKNCYVGNNLMIQTSVCVDNNNNYTVTASLVNIVTNEVIREINTETFTSYTEILNVVHNGGYVYIILWVGASIKIYSTSSDLTATPQLVSTLEEEGIGDHPAYITLSTADWSVSQHSYDAVIAFSNGIYVKGWGEGDYDFCGGGSNGVYIMFIWYKYDGTVKIERCTGSGNCYSTVLPDNYGGHDITGIIVFDNSTNSSHIYILESVTNYNYNLYKYVCDVDMNIGNREFITNIPKNLGYIYGTPIGAVYTYYNPEQIILHFFTLCRNSEDYCLEVISFNSADNNWVIDYICPFMRVSNISPFTVDASVYGENKYIIRTYIITLSFI